MRLITSDILKQRVCCVCARVTSFSVADLKNVETGSEDSSPVKAVSGAILFSCGDA